ncbi:MAG: hypothetical protein OXU70_04645 [Gammaproteobacteria bacterium]|nr:hypothetical protein [Gammaproteobacteria bacterium]
MKRCVLVIPDAGPLNSLWVADQLDLLLHLNMPIVVVDAVFDEVTSDLRYPKDAAVKAFIEANQPPFVIERTDIGAYERERQSAGKPRKRNAGELAMMDFISDAGGVRRYLNSNDPLLVLYEDRGLRVFQRPPNMHLLSTVGLLRGLEKVGVIPSADSIIEEMTHPTKPGRRPRDRRAFADLPDGVDEPAEIGSAWTPTA